MTLERVSFYDGRFSGVGWEDSEKLAETLRRRGLPDKRPKAEEEKRRSRMTPDPDDHDSTNSGGITDADEPR